jgi:hypothetical protein
MTNNCMLLVFPKQHNHTRPYPDSDFSSTRSLSWDPMGWFFPLVNFKWVIYQGFRIFGISKKIFCHVIVIMIHMSCWLFIHISIYHISIYPYIHISYIYISTHQSINIYISKFHIVAPLFPIVSDIVSTAHLGHGASDLQHPQVPTATGHRSQWTPRLGNEKDAVPKGLHHGHFVKGCIAHVTCII